MDELPPLDQLVHELDAAGATRRRDTPRLEDWLEILTAEAGSDLYLVAGIPPALRIHGLVRHLPEAPLDGDDVEESVLPALPRHAADRYRRDGCADASIRRGAGLRFRVNLHRERGRAAAAFGRCPPVRRTSRSSVCRPASRASRACPTASCSSAGPPVRASRRRWPRWSITSTAVMRSTS